MAKLVKQICREAHCAKMKIIRYRNHESNMRTCAHLGYMCWIIDNIWKIMIVRFCFMTISTKMAMIGTIPSRLCAKNQQLCKESLICMCIEKLKIFPLKISPRVTFRNTGHLNWCTDWIAILVDMVIKQNLIVSSLFSDHLYTDLLFFLSNEANLQRSPLCKNENN
jgi:hypothetical protein